MWLENAQVTKLLAPSRSSEVIDAKQRNIVYYVVGE